MPRYRKALDHDQQRLMDKVAAANLYKRNVVVTAKAEAAQMVRERIRSAEEMEFHALREAEAAGISRLHLAEEGLHTSDPSAVKKLMRKFDPHGEIGSKIGGPKFDPNAGITRFSWVDTVSGAVSVTYPNFRTTSLAPDYPAILTGVVRYVETAPGEGRWEVISDPTDQPGEFGVTPGFLRFELETVPQADERSLTRELNEWIDPA